ncbi:MAG: hypothetical protein GX447_06435 [Elusimicrobia bacterium]|nr:hypothetical protein [Elusimicrobiota bacterium]
MNDIEIRKNDSSQNDFVEAEIVGKKERIESQKKGFLKHILDKFGKTVFIISFLAALILIIIGALLSATFIGAFIGIPLIILGIIILTAGIKIYFSLSGRSQN